MLLDPSSCCGLLLRSDLTLDGRLVSHQKGGKGRGEAALDDPLGAPVGDRSPVGVPSKKPSYLWVPHLDRILLATVGLF